ncbi:hypothetical protein BsWGS_23763 [Bradybaena similaris]
MAESTDNLVKAKSSSIHKALTVSDSDDGNTEEYSNYEHPEQQSAQVVSYIYANDPNNLNRYLATLKSIEEVKEAVNARDSTGKSPLDIAASLGRVKITKMLLACGARFDSFNSKGYTCLHHAAAWGHAPVLTILVECGGNIYKRTISGETPSDIAARYNMMDCVELLELTAAQSKMMLVINQALEKLKDDRVNLSRISKEEKNLLLNACMENREWLENSSPTSQEVKDRIFQFEQALQMLFA